MLYGIASNDLSVVAQLIDAGADVNVKDQVRLTSLLTHTQRVARKTCNIRRSSSSKITTVTSLSGRLETDMGIGL